MNHKTLTVALGDRSYPIHIGEGVLATPELLQGMVGQQVVVVTNSTVAPLYLSRIEAMLKQLRSDISIHSVVLEDGESFKTLATLNHVFDSLLEKNCNRNVVLVALGGGVVGDITGFAAACYQRGVDFVQIPTTLLAQVDSSVGGKTGVNHPLGKNMIGAFYQPKAVLIDTGVLTTLPSRELSAGLAEVIKYGLIADERFFAWLEDNLDRLLAMDSDALNYAIYRSCSIKAEVVAEDEREGGRRAILNFGHTYGHAIEAHLGYGEWLHGEAVGAGMAMACQLSHSLGWLDAEFTSRALTLIARAGLPTEPPAQMSSASFQKYMKLDKKVMDGRIRLVLLQGCGKAVVTSDFDQALLLQQLNSLDGERSSTS